MNPTARMFALCLASATVCFAQTGSTSAVNGTVFDSQRAAVAGAKVTVRNARTGTVRDATTSEGGQYLLGNLEPGEYEITVEANGFKSAIAPGVPLQVARATTR